MVTIQRYWACIDIVMLRICICPCKPQLGSFDTHKTHVHVALKYLKSKCGLQCFCSVYLHSFHILFSEFFFCFFFLLLLFFVLVLFLFFYFILHTFLSFVISKDAFFLSLCVGRCFQSKKFSAESNKIVTREKHNQNMIKTKG